MNQCFLVTRKKIVKPYNRFGTGITTNNETIKKEFELDYLQIYEAFICLTLLWGTWIDQDPRYKAF